MISCDVKLFLVKGNNPLWQEIILCGRNYSFVEQCILLKIITVAVNGLLLIHADAILKNAMSNRGKNKTVSRK